MKKILPLLILAVAAVFLLSSCDQILEAFYPAETGQLTRADNTITIDVTGRDHATWNGNGTIYTTLGGWWQYENQFGYVVQTNPNYGGTAVIIELTDQFGNLVEARPVSFTPNGNMTRTATTSFSNLKDGSYSFQVWYDVDGDGKPDLEMNNYYYYYYIANATLNGSNVSSVFVSSGGTATVAADLYEYYY